MKLLRWVGQLALVFEIVIIAAMAIGNWLPGHLIAAEANFEIFVVDVDRKLAVNVSPPFAAFADDRDVQWSAQGGPLYGYPVWSHDGTWLAFHKWYVGRDAGDITVLDAFTGAVQQYAASANYQDTLSWGPEGEKLAYIYVDSPNPKERYNVALLTLATGQHTVLTHIGQVINPIWSPDGEWIAFRTLGGVSLVQPSITTNPGEGQPLTERGGHQSVTWSPDGARLSLLSYSGSHDSNFSSHITVIEPGEAPNELACDDINPELYAVWSPGWQYLATNTGALGFTVLDMVTCTVLFTNATNSWVSPLWVTDERVVFTNTDTIFSAQVLSGSVKQIQLLGTVQHIASRPS